MKKTLSS